ncbi:MAG: fatty acid--CoA ligase, partial [Xanthobacteraceae bacterium]
VIAGLPAPLVDLHIVDADMADVPHDGKTPGEIVVRAPWLTMGYLNNPDASEQLWAGGYLHTGDVATWDATGAVRITDRLKDIIKSGGEWISSIQLEDIISEKKGVRRVAVIGVKDEKWGERPLALVVLEPEFAGKIAAEDLRAHVTSYADRGIISRLAIPERITLVTDLPLTAVGKIDKKVLHERYRHQEAA